MGYRGEFFVQFRMMPPRHPRHQPLTERLQSWPRSNSSAPIQPIQYKLKQHQQIITLIFSDSLNHMYQEENTRKHPAVVATSTQSNRMGTHTKQNSPSSTHPASIGFAQSAMRQHHRNAQCTSRRSPQLKAFSLAGFIVLHR